MARTALTAGAARALAKAPAFAVLAAGASLLAGTGCGKHREPSEEAPAPPASVIEIGVALGTCDDVSVCERECDAGSADRCRRLAATYALGRGAERDEAHATALYERACAMNDAPACVFAGQMREYAHGVPKDDAAAAALYERACGMGWMGGCYNQAIMLENGRGVRVDRARAADLYGRVCTAGGKAACDRAQRLRDGGGGAR